MANKLINSFFWKYLENSGSQFARFAISIVLARLLSPDDFGLLALVMAFIVIANIFVESGLKSALVQKKDADDSDYSTVFWLSLLIAVIAYAALYISAPLVAVFYKNESLTQVIRVLGITLFFGVLSSVQEAYVQKHFLFRKLFFRSLAAVIPSGILGIALAYSGFGVWALVWQQLTSAFLTCVFMYFMVPWKPSFTLSVMGAKRLFDFGYKLLFSALYSAICANLTNLLIGKIFTPAMLGHYKRGEQFPDIIMSNINGPINAVLFPALSDAQNDIERFRQIVRKCIKLSCFVTFPIMALLASSAKPTVLFVLGEKWLPCVVFLQVNCLIFAAWPLHVANLVAMNSLGRSDMFLKRGIATNTIAILAVVAALYFFRTPLAVILSQAVIMPIGCWLNSYPNKKLLNYGFTEQMKDILPVLVCSLVAGAAVFPLSFLAAPNFAIVLLQGVLGLLAYLGLARAFKAEAFDYAVDILRTSLKGGGKK